MSGFAIFVVRVRDFCGPGSPAGPKFSATPPTCNWDSQGRSSAGPPAWSGLRGPRQGTGRGLFTGGVNGSGSWKVPSADSRKVLKTFRKVLKTFRKVSGGFRKVSGSFREQPVNNETRVSAGLAVHRLFTGCSRAVHGLFTGCSRKLPEDSKNLPGIRGRNLPASRAVQLPLAGSKEVP